MAGIRLPRAAVANYVVGGLTLTATARWREPGVLAGAMSCYRSAVGSGLAHVPFFLALDLYTMALFGNEFSFGDADSAGTDGVVRHAYENRVLNRLLREQTFQQALEVLSYFQAVGDEDTVRRHPRVDRLTTLLLQKLAPHWPVVVELNAAHLRDLSLRAPEDGADGDLEAEWRLQAAIPAETPRQAELLSAFVESVTGVGEGAAPLAWSDIVPAEDLFELEHLDVLEHEYLRIHVRQVIRVRESIEPLIAGDIDLNRESADAESRFVDHSSYPTGGFAGLTTRGSFENLVLSELIYMGEDVAARTAALRGIDLFDLRYVEGELLYYTRDSGQLFRKRRSLHLALDVRTSLAIKYPEHPYQLGTLVTGFVLALIRDLSFLLSHDALEFHVYVLGDADGDAGHTANTLALLLQGPIQHGLVTVGTAPKLELDTITSATRKSYLVGLSAEPSVLTAWETDVSTRRAAATPLYGVMVHLGGGMGPGVLEMDPGETTLGELETRLIQAIMSE